MITTKDGKQKEVVFISVPMHGKDAAVIRRHIQVVKAWYLKNTNQSIRDVCFIDNFDNGILDEKYEKAHYPRIKYLGRAIKRMADADVVVFGHNWRNSIGCMLENEVARNYKIDTMYYYHAIKKNDDLQESVERARECGVPEEEILHNLEEVDNFFTK